MKIIPALSLTLLASLGLVTAASAATFAPPSTSFTGTGPVTIVKGGLTLACTLTVNGATNASGSAATITSLSTSGGILCGALPPQTVSWSMIATSTTSISITASPIWGCGAPPAPIIAPWSNSSNTLTLSYTTAAPICTVTGSVNVPGITVF